ncbi:MAG: TAXI family TRAP transporter solute-binding subunit [Hyphomicrobiaceae bacterium]
MKLMTRVKAVALAAVAAGLVAGPVRTAQALEPVPVLLCPFGCGLTESETILMNQMLTSGAKVALLPQETPGYMFNIQEMANKAKWKKFLFGTEDTIIQLAFQGGSPELKEFLPKPVKIPFKLLYGEGWWGQGKFLATFNCNLKTMADLKGKRISLGLRGQSDWGVFARLFLEHAYGITPKNSDIRHMTPAQLTQQLIDGVTDASVTPVGTEPNLKAFLLPGPIRQLEAASKASGKKLCYIGVTKEDVDKVNKKFGTTFLHVTLPAGTLPGQDKPLGAGFVRGFKASHAEFPEKTAYEIVMAVAKIGPKMKDLHPVWRIWSPELMLHGLSEENVHPGAKRAYVELGWWDKHKKYPPVTYPKQ